MKQLVFSFKEKFIKAALVEKNGNTFDVITTGYTQLSPGSIEAGVIKNYDEVKEKLNGLIGGVSKARSHHILVLLSEETSFLKVLKDSKSKDVLDKPEVQEDIPYSLKGSFTSLRLLKNKDIQLVAAPRELISTYQKIFRELNLEIGSIIPEPVVFIPRIQEMDKPNLVISQEDDSVLFTVIYKSGIYFSTTKHFQDGKFDQSLMFPWIKEIVDTQIKDLTPTFDFVASVFGEKEEEILKILQENNIIVKDINVQFGKLNPQVEVSRYKKLIIATDINKQLPGFHIKDLQESKSSGVMKVPPLPKVNSKLIIGAVSLLLIIFALAFLTPKLIDILTSKTNQATTSIPVPASTSSATATPSATPSAKEKPKEATKTAKKKEVPKPILKRSSLKINVLNGNGTSGAAGEGANFLTSKGYKVISTGNAANYNYSKTEIRLKKSKSDFFALLTKDLGSRYTVIKGTNLAESSTFDAQVIIGEQ